MNEHNKCPELRLAQKKLAYEVTRVVHGDEIVKRVKS